MPVIIRTKNYEWLRQIGVFRNNGLLIKNSPQLCEVPYDEQIYLHNGYLIGIALRKFVKPYSSQYNQLLKVRKIATLKSSQNWNIIEPHLMRIGYQLQQEQEKQEQNIYGYAEHRQVQVNIISTAKIAQMLQIIYDHYSPQQNQNKLKIARRAKFNYIDIHNFSVNKDISEAQNTLQMMCIVLARNLQISLGQALGLLVDKNKYLKKLIIQGSIKDQFVLVKKIYEDMLVSWQIFQQFFITCPQDQFKILQGLSDGVFSQDSDVVHLTLNLLGLVSEQQWFVKVGYYKLLSSSHYKCFNFTIQRLAPEYNKILNESLHLHINDKMQLLNILTNLVKTLPRTIYCKQIFAYVPISYFYEQCYKILNIEQIDEQPPKLIIKAKQLLTKLIVTYPEKIPNIYLNSIAETFKYNINWGYGQIYNTLALLFQILQALMLKQSHHIQGLFKIAMNYLKETYGQIRHWIIQNMSQLYQKMGKSFPLGCLIKMYSLSNIAQADQYKLFSFIAKDNHKINAQQSSLILFYLTKYLTTHIHGKCFLTLIHTFLSNHSQSSRLWAQKQAHQILAKVQNINIPMLNEGEINVLNPKPPNKNKVVHSLGMKRKEMLKYNQYQLAKQIIDLLTEVKNKQFLYQYWNMLGHTIQAIQKQIGHKKKELVRVLKKTRNKIKKNAQQILDSQPMDQIVKSIIMNRTASYSPGTPKNGLSALVHMTPSLSESKFLDSESRIIQSQLHDKRNTGTIIEEEDNFNEEEDNNEFINSSFKGKNKAGSQQISQKNNQNIWKGNQGEEGQWGDQNQTKFRNINMESRLMNFTDQNESQTEQHQQVKIIPNELLQHYEISYINCMKQKYSKILQTCTQIYQQCKMKFKQIDKLVGNFIQRLALPVLGEETSQQLFQKCKTFLPSQTSLQLVTNFLIQSAFKIFSFKQNRRITVTCVESLFRILLDNNNFTTKIKSRTKQKSGLIKTIAFDNLISRKIIEKNVSFHGQKLQSYAICFQVLSEILNAKLSLHLAQPISKQVNQLPKFNQNHERNYSSKKSTNLMNSSVVHQKQAALFKQFASPKEDDQNISNQLLFLQKELQKQHIPKQQQYQTVNVKLKTIKNRYRMRQKIKTQASVPQQHTQSRSNSKILQANVNNKQGATAFLKLQIAPQVNNKQLKTKLSQRIRILSNDLAKNKSKTDIKQNSKIAQVPKSNENTVAQKQMKKQTNKQDDQVNQFVTSKPK